MSGGKRLYILAQIALALLIAAAPRVQAQVAVDTISARYDNIVDTLFDDYDFDDYDTPSRHDDNANIIQNQSGESANTPPEQSDITGGPPATDTLSIRAPRSREELGKMSREELFRLAFRRAAPERPHSLIMRLFVEGRAFGNAEIVYDSAFASFNFISPLFAGYLDTLLLPNARAAAGDSTGYFNSAALEAAGYAVSLDELQYEMHVTVPPESKVLQRKSLGGGYARQPAGPEVKPSALSFYMNYRAEDRLQHSQYSYGPDYESYRYRYNDTTTRDPLNVDLDGALNVYGWVLESSAHFREPYSGGLASWENFQRGDVRLVRDIVPLRVRLTAGDVDMSSDLLSYSSAVGGLRLDYNDWFFGGEPASARSKVTFFMPRGGEVELYMDGRYQQRFYLPAGNHEISGFGGNVGRNRVRLVLRMDDGSVEEVPYEFVLGDPRNMLRGESRYTVTAGVRRFMAPAPAGYDYDAGDPAAGADFLYGLLPSVSVGMAAQASRVNGLAAAQMLWNMGGPGWVNARFYGSGGIASPGRTGGRADISYTADFGGIVKALDRVFFEGKGAMPNMSLSLRGYFQSLYYNANLFTQSGLNSPNAEMGGVSGNYGFGMFRGSASASGGATFYRKTDGVTGRYPLIYNYGLRVQQSIRRATFSANAGADVKDGVHKPYFSAFTNYALGARFGRHQFSASGDFSLRGVYVEPYTRRLYYPDSIVRAPDFDGPPYEEDTVKGHNDYRTTWGANAGWRWSNGGSGAGAQSYSASAGWRDGFGIPSVGANANNSFNRTQSYLDYGMTNYENIGYETMSHSARASLAGSFMFADGLWAFGRQTTGNFLLVDTRDNLKGATAHIDRSRLNRLDFSHNGLLGAAYQNYLMSYRPTEVSINMSGVAPGALLESDVYHVNGTYKRGHALRLGDKPQSIVYVRLMDGGSPLRYAYASIEPDDRGGAQGKRATFTNGDGALQIGNLLPGGKYRIKFSASTYLKDVVIEIPKNAGPMIELPDISVERE